MENDTSFGDPMKDSTHDDPLESTQYLDNFAEKHAQEGLKMFGLNKMKDSTLDKLVAGSELLGFDDDDKIIPTGHDHNDFEIEEYEDKN